MNETTFLIHSVITAFLLLWALRLGKSALIAIMALFAVLANIFVVKQMELFGLTITCSDVFAIGTMLGLSLMQEFFGKKEAKKAMMVSFFCMGVFLVLSQIHLSYRPSLFDRTQFAFATIFVSTPRIIVASFIAFYISQLIDIQIYSLLIRKWGRKAFIFRLCGTGLISQLADTVIFSFLGLFGIIHSLIHVMIVSFLIKGIILMITAPFLGLAKYAYRSSEHS